jgi:glycyl-tRNA synthetase beta chain
MKEPILQDALFEIGAEEIPASYCEPALAHMKAFAEEFLRSRNLPFRSAETCGTPRRLTLHLVGVAAKSEAMSEEVFGPSAKAAKDPQGQWTQAAKGFAQSQGASVEDLQIRPTKKGDYLCAVKKHAGIKAEKILEQCFTELLPTIPFPKKMVWNATQFKFARPVRNLVAIYGHSVLKVSVAGLKATNKTFALSHVSSKKITISSPQAYVTALKNNCILASAAARREAILQSASQMAKRAGGELKADEALLDEVVWLVEHPVAVMGAILPEFLSLPKEVLITCMKKHQKYLSILDAKGNLLPHFIAIRNGISEHQDIVRKGYEKVLNARLTDAKFFFFILYLIS